MIHRLRRVCEGMKRSLLCLMLWNASLLLAVETEWILESPREEARPQAVQKETGGHDGRGSLVLETGTGEHWIGCWTKTVPVTGGKHQRFIAWRKHSAMPESRRDVYARVIWQDDKGQPVKWETPAKQGYAKGTAPRAEPEYPQDLGSAPDAWAKVETILRAHDSRRGGDRLAGVGLQSDAGPRPCLRKSCLSREQHLHGSRKARLDDLRHL